jgi:hypothetical protein
MGLTTPLQGRMTTTNNRAHRSPGLFGPEALEERVEMRTITIRPLIALFGVTSALVLFLSVPSVSASSGVLAAKSAHASKTGCSQLTKAQIQPLIVHPITKVTVKAVTALEYTGSPKRVGQKCIFAAGPGDSEALTVTVVDGPVSANAYTGDLQGLGSGPVAVHGVGSKAVRAQVDAKGAAATTTLSALKGKTYCSVSPGDGDIPGVAQLEDAAGDSADIGNKAYAEIAAAIGTVCNRIFGSGNTTPDLTGLTQAGAAAAAAPTTTTTFPTGLNVQP